MPSQVFTRESEGDQIHRAEGNVEIGAEIGVMLAATKSWKIQDMDSALELPKGVWSC